MNEGEQFIKDEIIKTIKNSDQNIGKFGIILEVEKALNKKYGSRARKYSNVKYRIFRKMVEEKIIEKYEEADGSISYVLNNSSSINE